VAMLKALASSMTGPAPAVKVGRKRKSRAGEEPEGGEDRGDLADVSTGKGTAEDPLSFNDVLAGVSRRTAAASFFQLLVLRSWDVVQVEQPVAFEDIAIARTTRFAEALADVGTGAANH
jgi:hypothetical protein